MTLANDVSHIFTTKRKHPKMSNNSIKNYGTHKGQSPHFYIVPSKPVVVASAPDFFCLSSCVISLFVMYGETPSSMLYEPNLPLVVLLSSFAKVFCCRDLNFVKHLISKKKSQIAAEVVARMIPLRLPLARGTHCAQRRSPLIRGSLLPTPINTSPGNVVSSLSINIVHSVNTSGLKETSH